MEAVAWLYNQMGATMGQHAGPEFGEFWAEFKRDVRPEDLVDLVVPIYARHFEQDELEGLLAFNKSPLGQKLNGRCYALRRRKK